MKLWSAQELVDHEFPTPEFLVEPVFPQGGIGILHGAPGVGKTQFGLTLALAINNGLDLFGRFGVRQGPVVIMQADMTGQVQKSRLRKAIEYLKLEDTYVTANEDGSTPLINIVSLQITAKDVVKQIEELDPVLIIWDTLRKVHTLPENASESAVKVYRAARKVSPTAFHLFFHHDRKASRDPDAIDTAYQDFIGSVQWQGAADTTAQLETLDASPKRLVLRWHKARTAPEHMLDDIVLELDTRSMLLLPVRAYDKSKPNEAIITGRAARGEARRLIG